MYREKRWLACCMTVCQVCWGLVLIRWRRGVHGVTLLTGLSQLITWCPIRAQPAWLLFIYTQSWKRQSAGSSDRTSNTGTLQHIVLLHEVPINTRLLLTQTYTNSKINKVSLLYNYCYSSITCYITSFLFELQRLIRRGRNVIFKKREGGEKKAPDWNIIGRNLSARSKKSSQNSHIEKYIYYSTSNLNQHYEQHVQAKWKKRKHSTIKWSLFDIQHINTGTVVLKVPPGFIRQLCSNDNVRTIGSLSLSWVL